MLMRNGKPVYYAHLNGEFPERSTPEEVEALLDDRVALKVARRPVNRVRERRTYIVTITKKYPAWDDAPMQLHIDAHNQKEAISLARKEVVKMCLFTRWDGPILYSACRNK